MAHPRTSSWPTSPDIDMAAYRDGRYHGKSCAFGCNPIGRITNPLGARTTSDEELVPRAAPQGRPRSRRLFKIISRAQ